MNFIITGGAGFIGSQLGHYFHSVGHDVCLLDNMSYGKKDNLVVNGKHFGSFVEYDIRSNLNLLFKAYKPDVVLHLAGVAPLPDCQSDPVSAISNNVEGTANVLETCRLHGIKKVIFASTSAVYENCKNAPFKEDQVEEEPNLVYAVTKRQAELLCKSYVDVYNMDINILRFFNVYGPHQDFMRKQPPLLGYITKCLLDGETPTFYSDGNQKRDYVYIDDLIDLIHILVNHDSGLAGEVFNVCSGECYSVREIYDLFKCNMMVDNAAKYNSPETFWDNYPELFSGKHPLPRKRIVDEVNKFSLGCPIKSKQCLMWETKVKMKDGLAACIDYARNKVKYD